jgi:hypothetical protein
MYLGTTVTNQSFINEEIKSTLISPTVRYHFVQSHFSYRLLSKKLKIN